MISFYLLLFLSGLESCKANSKVIANRRITKHHASVQRLTYRKKSKMDCMRPQRIIRSCTFWGTVDRCIGRYLSRLSTDILATMSADTWLTRGPQSSEYQPRGVFLLVEYLWTDRPTAGRDSIGSVCNILVNHCLSISDVSVDNCYCFYPMLCPLLQDSQLTCSGHYSNSCYAYQFWPSVDQKTVAVKDQEIVLFSKLRLVAQNNLLIRGQVPATYRSRCADFDWQSADTRPQLDRCIDWHFKQGIGRYIS